MAIYPVLDIIVFVIGVMMVVKHYKKGWGEPQTLSGIAFILITLPSVLGMLGVY